MTDDWSRKVRRRVLVLRRTSATDMSVSLANAQTHALVADFEGTLRNSAPMQPRRAVSFRDVGISWLIRFRRSVIRFPLRDLTKSLFQPAKGAFAFDVRMGDHKGVSQIFWLFAPVTN